MYLVHRLKQEKMIPGCSLWSRAPLEWFDGQNWPNIHQWLVANLGSEKFYERNIIQEQ